MLASLAQVHAGPSSGRARRPTPPATASSGRHDFVRPLSGRLRPACCLIYRPAPPLRHARGNDRLRCLLPHALALCLLRRGRARSPLQLALRPRRSHQPLPRPSRLASAPAWAGFDRAPPALAPSASDPPLRLATNRVATAASRAPPPPAASGSDPSTGVLRPGRGSCRLPASGSSPPPSYPAACRLCPRPGDPVAPSSLQPGLPASPRAGFPATRHAGSASNPDSRLAALRPGPPPCSRRLRPAPGHVQRCTLPPAVSARRPGRLPAPPASRLVGSPPPCRLRAHPGIPHLGWPRPCRLRPTSSSVGRSKRKKQRREKSRAAKKKVPEPTEK